MSNEVKELLNKIYIQIDRWNKWELDKLYSDNNMKNLKENMSNISNEIKAFLYINLLIENKEINNVK